MSAQERAARLRELADNLDVIGDAEAAAAEAKAAYRNNPDDPDLKAAHQAAAIALHEARADYRASGLAVASTEPGSTTIIAPAMAGKAS